MPGLFLPRSRPWLLSTAAERRFEVRSCKPTSRGRPSSVKQLRTIRSREFLVLMAHNCRLSGQNHIFGVISGKPVICPRLWDDVSVCDDPQRFLESWLAQVVPELLPMNPAVSYFRTIVRQVD